MTAGLAEIVRRMRPGLLPAAVFALVAGAASGSVAVALAAGVAGLALSVVPGRVVGIAVGLVCLGLVDLMVGGAADWFREAPRGWFWFAGLNAVAVWFIFARRIPREKPRSRPAPDQGPRPPDPMCNACQGRGKRYSGSLASPYSEPTCTACDGRGYFR
ncbi:hypothetical protein HKCCE2091_09740 [Rhodobacterales bacterium HKCCE2091]|nr:hypothetical protein [Rhodobacterales bacterium HKCCE2091]